MKFIKFNLVCWSLLLWMLTGLMAQAAPFKKELLVNKETKECAIFSGGDECVHYTKPVSWESIEWTEETGCPKGFKMVELELKPEPVFSLFCLSNNHSGSDYSRQFFYQKIFPYLVGVIVFVAVVFIFLIRLIKKMIKK